ncbi:hypothetical protein PHYSODRAFT_335720 [Phytophthora sojae]|uniref:Uncharacterized protein n=1 Tax=Phytophthora sojae (strain P6497) TaxID=1094619 RepID=G4ZSG2_PHYSP|nr:hypothetical protein PHYSODRAFT_335720 [Phytophthora sojae]EGZ14042.1 hypothetical protein PHYSODRAFT_335720 [Phytophthora sojae]|eukprot:XP_009531471.1 hypothetical protein PHYSODRAFT_335720 [Phytophthora sojae]
MMKKVPKTEKVRRSEQQAADTAARGAAEPAEGPAPAAVAGLAKQQHQQQCQHQHQHQQRGDCAPTAPSFRALGWRGVRSVLSSWEEGDVAYRFYWWCHRRCAVKRRFLLVRRCVVL